LVIQPHGLGVRSVEEYSEVPGKTAKRIGSLPCHSLLSRNTHREAGPRRWWCLHAGHFCQV